ncbi:MAG: transcriptional repressor [Sneathiella sp.]|uniref:Fur family transcriptional regulator n=1 Tax=Sneathiella sp. TaxID=1964365 RepID=UPI000C5CEB82|nr:Fur family transcriptional regulator [Sneathiella sp.]MAZ02495.1 transcriptional repressor [Sneathiella sp.]|tara:strand:- start:51620 stop:52084 length:465 start_codon:yes stop_codon:yes gene_type:complete
MHNCTTHNDCIADALERAEEICAERDLRFTDVRRKVLELVWQSHGPIKAYDILDRLDQRIAAIKPPTVYRALEFLTENGLVHKISSLNAFVGCSHPLKHRECYFLICSDCGEAKECCNPDITDIISKTSQRNEFVADHVTLEITGECGDCRRTH